MPTTTIPILLALAVALVLTTCERNKLLDIDPHTGYFTYADGKTEIPDSAVVIKNTPFDLDAMNDLVVVNNHVNIFVMISRQDFTLDMVNKIGYFNQTMSIAQLRALMDERNITSDELTAAISADDEVAMVQAIAKAWRPFLWLRWGYLKNSNIPGDEYYSLSLTNALTLEDYFVVVSKYRHTTQPEQKPQRTATYKYNHYPMLNEFVGYIKEHSDRP